MEANDHNPVGAVLKRFKQQRFIDPAGAGQHDDTCG
jgi:hypothetical protein